MMMKKNNKEAIAAVDDENNYPAEYPPKCGKKSYD